MALDFTAVGLQTKFSRGFLEKSLKRNCKLHFLHLFTSENVKKIHLHFGAVTFFHSHD